MTTKSKELTVPQPAGAVDVWAEQDWEPDQVVGVAPAFPEIKLIQKAMPNIPDSGKHSGEFHFSDTGKFAVDVSGVFISVASPRVAFDERDRTKPACASDDGIAPRPMQPLWDQQDFVTKNGVVLPITHAQPKSCGTCAFSVWRENPDGERIPPPCAEGAAALFEEAETLSLYRIRFKGTGLKTMRAFLSSLAGTGFKRGATRIGKPIFSKRVLITATEGKRDSFLWYQPEISVEGDVDPVLAGEYTSFARQVREQFRRTVAETHAEDEAAETTVAADDGWDDGTEAFR